MQGFGVGAAAVGTTISVYAIARLMMNLPAGMLADEKGRKPLLVWGPAITAIGMTQHICDTFASRISFKGFIIYAAQRPYNTTAEVKGDSFGVRPGIKNS